MRRTLLLIPHEIASVPVFGFGWLFGLLLIGFFARLVWALKRPGSPVASARSDSSESNTETTTVVDWLWSEGILWAAGMIAVVYVLPQIELTNVDNEPVGMAIRGYGVMLVIAIGSAVGLSAYRVRRAGMDPDWVYSLAPLLLISGIVGARAFFVIQYFDQFKADSLGQTVRNVLAFTEGGLVIYGSMIGGFLAFCWFAYRRKIPMLRFGDAIIPCVFLGVFFGRIGCLMNGCCYGGRCEDGWASLRFPPITAVYNEQLQSGELLGMDIDPATGRVREVVPGSVAAELGIQAGSRYDGGEFDVTPFQTADRTIPEEEVVPGWTLRVSGRKYVLSPQELPAKALPVRAAQPISSTNALLLCGLLWFISRFIHRDGALLAIGFAGYAVNRFGLELVRVDEGGQFNTSLTISQWVSVCVFVLSIVSLAWLYTQAPRTTTAAVSD
ncbi:MAG: prolipoprotein diacylglyceryl transferase family protein [Planctomycetota bacterium]